MSPTAATEAARVLREVLPTAWQGWLQAGLAAGRVQLWQLACQGETCPWVTLSSTGLAALEQRPLPCPKPSPPNGVSQHPGSGL